jgi:hypothetical protein
LNDYNSTAYRGRSFFSPNLPDGLWGSPILLFNVHRGLGGAIGQLTLLFYFNVFLVSYLKVRVHLGDLGVDGRICKSILMKKVSG